MSLKISGILLLISILALTLRIYKIAEVPPALNWDEISHGYNGYSILKTGYDQWGQFLPIFNFRAYGDYPLPLYMYFSMPFIAIFGLNEASIRIVSVIFGTLLVPVVFYLFRRIFANDYFSLLVAFLLAISPWSILTSRQVLQVTPAVFFLTLGILLFIKGVRERKNWVVLGTALIGLSAYGYHNTRILAGPIIVILVLFFWQVLKKSRKTLFLVIIVTTLLILPIIPVIFSSQGSARVRWVGIVDQGAINRIEDARNTSNLPEFLNVSLNNRYTYTVKVFLNNYFGYFNPVFLGLNGGTNLQFSVLGFGLISPFTLPFFYFGLIFLAIRFRSLEKDKRIILILMLLTPIPAAITKDPFQVVRSMLMLPFVCIITVFGISLFIQKFRKFKMVISSLLIFVGIATLVHFFNYFSSLINVYPIQSSFAWQYGYKEAIDYVKLHNSEYSKIIFTKKYGEPHEFVLFYLQYDPKTYQQDPTAIRYQAYDWFWVDKFDKYEFLNDEDIISKTLMENNALLITTPNNYPPNRQLLKTINFLDGQKAFDIVKL